MSVRSYSPETPDGALNKVTGCRDITVHDQAPGLVPGHAREQLANERLAMEISGGGCIICDLGCRSLISARTLR